MKKLIIKEFGLNLNLDNNDNYQLIFESKKMFYKVNQQLFDDNYLFFLDLVSDDKKESLDSIVDYVENLLFLDINNKKNLNSIYKQIKNIYQDDILVSIKEIKCICEDFFKKVFVDYDLELYSNLSMTQDDFLKMLNIRLKERGDSLLENIIGYMKATIELRKIKVFIVYNISLFLEQDEILMLIKESKLMNVILIDLEVNCNCNNCFDHRYILDNDCCVI